MNNNKIEEIKVSVIVPVYNAEKYIKKCVNSVECQTHTNLEIILVDDGSKDSSGQICDNFAHNDDRIIVLHQENMGQSVARNNAMKIATGEYFVFVDSDDVISPVMIEKLLECAIKTDSEICMCDFIMFFDEVYFEKTKANSKEKIYQGKKAIEFIHTVPGEKYVVLWAKIFKKSLFEKITFPEGRICEDLAVLYKLYYKANSISEIDEALYGYYRANESSSTFILSEKYYKDVYLALDEEMDFMQENCPEYYEFAAKTNMYWHMDEYRKLFRQKKEKKYRKELYKEYKRLYYISRDLPKEKFYKYFRFAPKVYSLLKK